MKASRFLSLLALLGGAWALALPVLGASLVSDHRTAKLSLVPETDVALAKSSLHIAYGHTSHGSQIITGMEGLLTFKPGYDALYSFQDGGGGGALDLRDCPFSGADDLGNPDRTSWAAATRDYLDAHPEINVVIWSWCGQVSDSSAADIVQYLTLMSGLEQDYPGVSFVYMTGHLDGSGSTGNLHLRNEQIRAYCLQNGKILYDFADIESYNPDGNAFLARLANDNCDYDSDNDGELEIGSDKNWALQWQNTHDEGVDWYACEPAHTQALNGNLKAYAAWYLWTAIARRRAGAVAGDFDGDSLPDVFWRNPATGADSIWYMQPRGTAVKSSKSAPSCGTAWEIAAAADFNGDGVPDLLWRNPATGADALWYLQPGGTAIQSSRNLPACGTAWSIAGAADFNADGVPDIVWRNPATGGDSLWYMKSNGTGILSSRNLPACGTSWNIAAISDFNADGVPDILWRNPATGANSLWYMQPGGATIQSTRNVPPCGAAWEIGKAADFDGDGVPDLLWRNPATGADSIWYMQSNGTAIKATAGAPACGTSWRIEG